MAEPRASDAGAASSGGDPGALGAGNLRNLHGSEILWLRTPHGQPSAERRQEILASSPHYALASPAHQQASPGSFPDLLGISTQSLPVLKRVASCYHNALAEAGGGQQIEATEADDVADGARCGRQGKR